MKLIPDKLRRRPYVTWAFILLSLAVLVLLFGRDNVWMLISTWLMPVVENG